MLKRILNNRKTSGSQSNSRSTAHKTGSVQPQGSAKVSTIDNLELDRTMDDEKYPSLKQHLVRFSESLQLKNEITDTIHPPEAFWSFNNYIVGVSEHLDGWNDSYQFIFSDGTRTQSNETKLKDKSRWKDKMIPTGAVISKVEVMFDRSSAKLMGISFADNNKKVMVSAGRIDLAQYKNKKGFPTQILILKADEHLIGVLSS